MKISVYVDILFCLNLFINYFLLLLTSRISHQKINRLRIIIASIIGAIYACVIFFVNSSQLIVFISKFIVAILIVYISFLPKILSKVFHLGLIFLIINLILGGGCYLIYFMFAPFNMAFSNTVVYINISPIILIAVTILTYITLTFAQHFLKPHFLKEKTFDVQILHNQSSCTLKGFIDTGNNLVDFFTNAPIVVCSYYSLEKLFNEDEKQFYKNFSYFYNYHNVKVRIVPVNTVCADGLLPAFVPSEFSLKSENKSYKIKNVLIAVSNEPSLKNKPVILNPKLISE